MRYGTIKGVDRPVSRIFLGTASAPFSTGGDGSELLEAALEQGINAIDTARVYGLSENSLGRWLEQPGNREKVVLLSKCGHPAEDGTRRVRAGEMNKDLETSLEALRTDYVDIWLLHRDDPEIPVGKIMDTFQEMKEKGRIRAFGGSNWTRRRIQEANEYAAAHGLQPMTASSPQFGLANQVTDPWGGNCVTISGPAGEEDRKWYRESGMPVIAYSSLARGLMAGKIKSTDEERVAELLDPFAVKGYASHENFMRLARCEELSAKKGCSVSQLAIAWMFTQGLNLFAAATTTKVSRIPEQVRALHVELTPEEAAWLNLEN